MSHYLAKNKIILKAGLICLLVFPLLLSFKTVLCRAETLSTNMKYVPSWVKIKFFQSYGYSWDQAPLEQRMRFIQYCNRMQAIWAKQDRQYEKSKAKTDQRLQKVEKQKKKLEAQLQKRAALKAKKEAVKKRVQQRQIRQQQNSVQTLKKLLPKHKTEK